MAKSIEDILKIGFQLWRKNLNLALPFFLNFVISCLLSCLFFLTLFSMLNIPVTTDITSIIESLSTTLETANVNLILEILLLMVFLTFILMIIESFFIIGAAGMAKTVIETGNPSLSDMFHYGGEKLFDFFIARFCLLILTSILAALFIGTSLIIFSILQFIGSNILRFGISLFGFSLLIISILFIPLPFAIVFDNLKPIDALKKSYRFTMDNKLPVAILFVFIKYLYEFSSYFTMLIAAIVFSAGVLALPWHADVSDMNPYSLTQFLTNLFIVIAITVLIFILISLALSIFVFMPLNTLWWSLLYMDRKTEKRKNDKIY